MGYINIFPKKSQFAAYGQFVLVFCICYLNIVKCPLVFSGFRKFKINCSYFTDLTRFFFLYIFENLFSIASTN